MIKLFRINLRRIANTGDLREVLSHSKNYLTGNIATKALGLISMPVFTRLMDERDYGIVAVYMATLGILVPISTLSITDSIGRYYYEKGQSDFGHFISSIVQFLLFIQVPMIILFIVFRESFVPFLGLPVSLSFIILIGLVHGNIKKVFRGIFISRKMSKPFVKVSLFESFSGFGISWLFLLLLNGSHFILRIVGVLTSQVLSAGWMTWRISNYIDHKKLDWNHIRYSLHFGLPRLPFVLSGVILSQFDRVMLSNISGLEEAGLYSVGYNVGALSLLVIGAITPAFIPNFYQLMNEGKTVVVDKLNRQLLWLICSAGTGLMLFGGLILRFLADERFHEGARVVPAVVMGYMFYAVAGVYNRYSGYYKVTIFQSLGALLAGASNIILNILWLPKFGIIAAAYTTLISYAIQAIVTWLLIRLKIKGHVTPLKHVFGPILLVLLVFIFLEGRVIWDLIVSCQW